MISEQEKFDSRINTWFWMYSYYLRQKEDKYAQYFWKKFIMEIFSKSSAIKELGLSSFPTGVSMLDSTHAPGEMETLILEQLNKIKQLENRSNNLEKLLTDLKNSISFRLGNILLWPIKSILRR